MDTDTRSIWALVDDYRGLLTTRENLHCVRSIYIGSVALQDYFEFLKVRSKSIEHVADALQGFNMLF